MGSKANLAERHGMSSSFFVQIFDFSVQKIKKYLDVFYQTTPCFFESSANSNKQNTPLTSIPPNGAFAPRENKRQRGISYISDKDYFFFSSSAGTIR